MTGMGIGADAQPAMGSRPGNYPNCHRHPSEKSSVTIRLSNAMDSGKSIQLEQR